MLGPTPNTRVLTYLPSYPKALLAAALRAARREGAHVRPHPPQAVRGASAPSSPHAAPSPHHAAPSTPPPPQAAPGAPAAPAAPAARRARRTRRALCAGLQRARARRAHPAAARRPRLPCGRWPHEHPPADGRPCGRRGASCEPAADRRGLAALAVSSDFVPLQAGNAREFSLGGVLFFLLLLLICEVSK